MFRVYLIFSCCIYPDYIFRGYVIYSLCVYFDYYFNGIRDLQFLRTARLLCLRYTICTVFARTLITVFRVYVIYSLCVYSDYILTVYVIYSFGV